MQTAEYILTAIEWYAYAGGAVALAFLVWGVDRIDEAAHGTFVFRALLVPGLVGLWPLVVVMWIRHAKAGGV